MVGRKSVTTSCRHWKAVLIKDSLESRIKDLDTENSNNKTSGKCSYYVYSGTRKALDHKAAFPHEPAL